MGCFGHSNLVPSHIHKRPNFQIVGTEPNSQACRATYIVASPSAFPTFSETKTEPHDWPSATFHGSVVTLIDTVPAIRGAVHMSLSALRFRKPPLASSASPSGADQSTAVAADPSTLHIANVIAAVDTAKRFRFRLHNRIIAVCGWKPTKTSTQC